MARAFPNSMSRFVLAMVSVAVVALASASSHAATDPSVFVSATGSDSSSCGLASNPCRSFDVAYRRARSGAVVEVAAGTYSAQTIERDASKAGSTQPVTFRPAARAVVTIDCNTLNCIAVEASYVTVERMRTAYRTSTGGRQAQGGVCICRGSTNVSFVGIDAGHIFIAGDNARVIGGDYGPEVDEVAKVSGAGATPTTPVRNTLIDGATFHDFARETSHMECLNVESAAGLVVRNSRFDNCAVFGIILKEEGATQTMRDVTIENNWLSNSASVAMSQMIRVTTGDSTCENIAIRHNTVAADDVVADCPGSNIRVESNILHEHGQCAFPPGTAFTFNVIELGESCGGTNRKVADAGFVDRARNDFHLRRTSPAVGRGALASGGRDREGDTRPARGPSDAGADQREPSTIVLGSAIGSAKMGMRRAAVEAFYGRGRRASVRLKDRRLSVVRYARPVGSLFVGFVAGRVVALGTTTPVHATRQGFGPGARERRQFSPAALARCLKAYRMRSAAGADVFVGRSRGGSVTSLWMVRRPYAAC